MLQWCTLLSSLIVIPRGLIWSLIHIYIVFIGNRHTLPLNWRSIDPGVKYYTPVPHNCIQIWSCWQYRRIFLIVLLWGAFYFNILSAGLIKLSQSMVNSLAPGRSGSEYKITVFKLILQGILSTYCENVLSWMQHNITNDESTLVKVMAWCRWATSHYTSQRWLYFCRHMVLLGHYGLPFVELNLFEETQIMFVFFIISQRRDHIKSDDNYT